MCIRDSNSGWIVITTAWAFAVFVGAYSAVAITFSTTGNTADGLASAITAFNERASTTGVTAKLNQAKTGITLTNESGSNITIASGAGNTDFTVAGITVASTSTALATGQLTLDSDKSFGVVGGNSTDFFSLAASTAGKLQEVSKVDVSSADAATRTLSMVDSALSAINGPVSYTHLTLPTSDLV